MKKLTAVILIMALSLFSLTACGEDEQKTEGEATTVTASESSAPWDFTASDYVELCEYKGINVEKPSLEVSDDELNMYIDYILSFRSETKPISDRDDVREGDVVNIDYEGKIDGVAFNGGTAQGIDLTIGSGQLIPGFEDALIGFKLGETGDINVTFPEAYAEELAGKDAVFTVTINEIKEEVKPELTDDFVKEIDPKFTNVDEFKKEISDQIRAEKESDQDEQILGQIQQKLMDESKIVKDIPDEYVQKLYNSTLNDLNSVASTYGMDVAMVASQYYGVSADNYEAEILTELKENVAPQYAVLFAIAEKENLIISKDDIDSEIQKMIDESQTGETIEAFKQRVGDLEVFREYLIIEKVFDFLKENAVINE
ncbi:MAG: trigger factor [Lachnospiraceae bacterium]|nr:trigger factor [Lachnospiraceae bacterium]